MEVYFATMFGDVRHESSLILLLSLTDPDILRQSKVTHFENDIIRSLASAKLHRQRIMKEHVAMSLLVSQLEEYFLFFE